MTATVRITDLIDGRRLGAFQFTVAALCALIGFTEGFDINSAGYFAPALAKALSLKHGALGLFFSTGLFGLMLGGLFIAPIADHIIPLATSGALQADFAAIPYRRKRDLDFFPRIADPLAQS